MLTNGIKIICICGESKMYKEIPNDKKLDNAPVGDNRTLDGYCIELEIDYAGNVKYNFYIVYIATDCHTVFGRIPLKQYFVKFHSSKRRLEAELFMDRALSTKYTDRYKNKLNAMIMQASKWPR